MKTEPKSNSAILTILFIIAAVFLLLSAVITIVSILRYSFVLYGSDATLFWAVGRGMTNNLRPYIDLFENKPPGIFLLSAFSYYLTDSQFFVHFFNSIAFLILIFSPLAYLLLSRWNDFFSGKRLNKSDIALILAALFFGVSTSLYAFERGGSITTEIFAASVMNLYAMFLAARKKASGFSFRDMLLASLFLLAAIGFKEPFLLIAFSIALIFSNSPGDLLKSFILPLIIAAAAGSIVMALMGILLPYITLYLPYMLTWRISAKIGEYPGESSILQRGTYFGKVGQDLGSFSIFFLILVLFVAAVFIFAFLRKSRCGLGLLARIMSVLAIIYLTVFSIAVGGFFSQHYISLVPVIFSMFLFIMTDNAGKGFLFIKDKHKHENVQNRKYQAPYMKYFTAILLLLVVLSAFSYSFANSEKAYLRQQENEREARLNAAYIDNILDATGDDRYFFIGTSNQKYYAVFAFTRHSPYGPVFNQNGGWLDVIPGYKDDFRNDFQKSRLVVYDVFWSMDEDLKEQILKELNRNFSLIPWDSVSNISVDSHRYLYFFRKL